MSAQWAVSCRKGLVCDSCSIDEALGIYWLYLATEFSALWQPDSRSVLAGPICSDHIVYMLFPPLPSYEAIMTQLGLINAKPKREHTQMHYSFISAGYCIGFHTSIIFPKEDTQKYTSKALKLSTVTLNFIIWILDSDLKPEWNRGG